MLPFAVRLDETKDPVGGIVGDAGLAAEVVEGEAGVVDAGHDHQWR
jgi:hypothetical protein